MSRWRRVASRDAGSVTSVSFPAAPKVVSAAVVSHWTFQSLLGPQGGNPGRVGVIHPPMSTTLAPSRSPGLAAASSARLVYGPMATIVALASTLASSNSTAAASGPGGGVTSTLPQYLAWSGKPPVGLPVVREVPAPAAVGRSRPASRKK